MSYKDIITIEPGKCGGQPCIRGHRLTVADILGQLAAGDSVETVLEDFPFLTREDISAALAFAAGDLRGRYGSQDADDTGAAA